MQASSKHTELSVSELVAVYPPLPELEPELNDELFEACDISVGSSRGNWVSIS